MAWLSISKHVKAAKQHISGVMAARNKDGSHGENGVAAWRKAAYQAWHVRMQHGEKAAKKACWRKKVASASSSNGNGNGITNIEA